MTSQSNTGAYQEIQCTSHAILGACHLFQSVYHANLANQCVSIPFQVSPRLLPGALQFIKYVCKIIPRYIPCHLRKSQCYIQVFEFHYFLQSSTGAFYDTKYGTDNDVANIALYENCVLATWKLLFSMNQLTKMTADQRTMDT